MGPNRSIYQRVRRGVIVLFSGNGISAILGFVALALNARALGPELFGVLALLQSILAISTQVFGFDTWQTVVRYGAIAQAKADPAGLRDVVILGIVYDAISAIVATIIAVLVVLFAAPVIGVSDKNTLFALFFAVSVIASFNSTAKGLLRLFGLFASTAVIQVVTALLTMVGAAAFLICDAPFWMYVVLYAAAPGAVTAMMWGVVAWHWRALGLPRLLRISPIDLGLRREFSRFSWAASGTGVVNALRQNGDLLVLGLFLGPAAVGYYRLAVQMASTVSKVGDPLAPVLYVEVASLVGRGEFKTLRKMIVIGSLCGLIATLIISVGAFVFSAPAVLLFAGPNFGDAAAPLVWLAIANALTLNHVYLRAAITNLSGAGAYLATTLAGTAAFLPAIYLGIHFFGVSGAGVSQLAYSFVWLAASFGIVACKLDIGPAAWLSEALQISKSLLSRIRRSSN